MKGATGQLNNLIGGGSIIAGPTQNAQTPIPCGGRTLQISGQSFTDIISKCTLYHGPRAAIIMDLLLYSGLRASEVCSITPLHIIDDSRVYVPGLKGSENRLCTLVEARGLLQFKLFNPQGWTWGLNRWYIYRLCKELGVYADIVGNRKQAVTHAGRHALVADLAGMGLQAEDIKKVIGHKSVKSTQWYMEHKPRK